MRRFFSELKRRRVFRVAWIYVVAAWVVIQVAATLTPALDLPAGLVRITVYFALVGFPIALLLAWAFDLTAAGVERTQEGGSARGQQLIRARWLRPAIVVGLLLIFAGGALVWWLRIRQGRRGDEPVAIAVFPFAVQGSPSVLYLRDGMVSLLSTKLDGAGELRASDPTAVIKALGEHPPDEITTRIAEPIARRFGARLYILGAVTELDGKLTLSAALYDLDDKKRPPTQASVTDSKENVLPLVDLLTTRLLAERFQEPANRLARAASLTTSSLPALKAYLAGETEYRASRWTTATDYFKRALAEDSTYALAAYRLAAASEWAADFETARPATALALRHRDRLTRRDRLFLDGFAAWQRGDPNTAEPIYRQLVEDFPEDVEAWYRLGEVQFHFNPVRGRSADSARVAFEHAIALDPALEALRFHLMEMALADRDYVAFDSIAKTVDLTGEAALRRTAPRVFARNNQDEITRLMSELRAAEDGTVFAVAAATAQYSLDFDNAARVAALLTDSTRMWVSQGVGHLFLAELDAGRGRWQSSKHHLDNLRKLSGCGTKYRGICEGTAREYESLYALSPLLNVGAAGVRALRGQLEEWQVDSIHDLTTMPPEYLGVHTGAHAVVRSYLIGIMSGLLGEAGAAEANARFLEQLTTTDSTSSLPALSRSLAAAVRAQAAFKLGDHDQALALLSFPVHGDVDYLLASPFFSHAYNRFMHGELLIAKEDDKAALPWFESLLQSRSDLFLAGPALLRQAQIHERIGSKQKAAALYAEFARLWNGSDANLREPLIEAQKKAQSPRKK